jgi:hypothetical protein
MEAGTDLGTPMLGFRNKLYVATSFSWSSPTWDEAATVKEVDLNKEFAEKEINAFGITTTGVELGYGSETLTVKFANFDGDADRGRFETAFHTQAPMICCVANGDIDDADVRRNIAAWICSKRQGPHKDDDPDETTFELRRYRPLQYPAVWDLTT